MKNDVSGGTATLAVSSTKYYNFEGKEVVTTTPGENQVQADALKLLPATNNTSSASDTTAASLATLQAKTWASFVKVGSNAVPYTEAETDCAYFVQVLTFTVNTPANPDLGKYTVTISDISSTAMPFKFMWATGSDNLALLVASSHDSFDVALNAESAVTITIIGWIDGAAVDAEAVLNATNVLQVHAEYVAATGA